MDNKMDFKLFVYWKNHRDAHLQPIKALWIKTDQPEAETTLCFNLQQKMLNFVRSAL